MRLSHGRTAPGALVLGWALVQRSKRQRPTRPGPTSETVFTPVIPSPYRPPRGALVAFALLLSAGAAGYAGYKYKKSLEREQSAIRMTGGDPRRAEAHCERYGCAGCHTIPGISRTNGLVGPHLGSIARRVYIAGMLANSPDNLVWWIVNPREVNPKTAMPVTGILEAEARDVAVYLYSLR